MSNTRHRSFVSCVFGLLFASTALSCSAITVDCGGPTTREVLDGVTLRDAGDTLSVDGYVSEYEERGRDGSYLHQLVVTVQATNAVHYDTIPTALRPHVTGARLELPSGA